jgi:hypothetical protein
VRGGVGAGAKLMAVEDPGTGGAGVDEDCAIGSIHSAVESGTRAENESRAGNIGSIRSEVCPGANFDTGTEDKSRAGDIVGAEIDARSVFRSIAPVGAGVGCRAGDSTRIRTGVWHVLAGVEEGTKFGAWRRSPTAGGDPSGNCAAAACRPPGFCSVVSILGRSTCCGICTENSTGNIVMYGH